MDAAALPLLSVVSPAYNEADNIAPIYHAVLEAVSGCAVSLELVLVDDGSRDGTRAAIAALSQVDARVRLVALTRNFGHQAALLAGLSAARGDVVVTLDCDLQHPPSLIPDMLSFVAGRFSDCANGSP